MEMKNVAKAEVPKYGRGRTPIYNFLDDLNIPEGQVAIVEPEDGEDVHKIHLGLNAYQRRKGHNYKFRKVTYDDKKAVAIFAGDL